MLHRDGSWSHEGIPLRHPRLRAAFDRSVRYLPQQRKYVVQLGRFRGEIEVEEAAFFVRELDRARGRVRLLDQSWEPLEVASLRMSACDGALLCRVKHTLAPGGLVARFTHAAQAELLDAVEPGRDGPTLRLAGRLWPLPAALRADTPPA